MRRLFDLCAVAVIGLVFVCSTRAEEPVRTWRDSTGQYQIEARLVRVQGANVFLRGTDNVERNVPLDKLSAADREYLKTREAPPAPATSVPPTTPTPPATSAAPAAPATAAAPGMIAPPAAPKYPPGDNAPPVSRAVPLAPRTWTAAGMPPLEAGFVDIRLGNPRDSSAMMFPGQAASVVLQAVDGKEKLIPFNRLSDVDRQYIQNRVVTRTLSEAEREQLAQPIDWGKLPEVVNSLVVVEATAGDQVRHWPALVVQADNGTAFIRTEHTGRSFSKDGLPSPNYSVVVRNPDGTTRKVAARLLGYAQSKLVLAAPAAEVPKPLTDFRGKALGSEQPAMLYGLRFEPGAAAPWTLVRCATTFRRRSPEQNSFDAEAGDLPPGTAIVIGEDGSYGGLCGYSSSRAVLAPDGSETVLLSYQQLRFNPIVDFEGPRAFASDVQMRKGKEAGVAELLFMWNDLFPQGTVPRLVLQVPGRTGSTISSFTVSKGELFRAAGYWVLECVEITDPTEVETVLRSCVPRGIVSPGNRPMKAAFRYDPAVLGADYPIGYAAVKYDEKTGKYVGQADVQLRETVSFKNGAQNVQSE